MKVRPRDCLPPFPAMSRCSTTGLIYSSWLRQTNYPMVNHYVYLLEIELTDILTRSYFLSLKLIIFKIETNRTLADERSVECRKKVHNPICWVGGSWMGLFISQIIYTQYDNALYFNSIWYTLTDWFLFLLPFFHHFSLISSRVTLLVERYSRELFPIVETKHILKLKWIDIGFYIHTKEKWFYWNDICQTEAK